MRETTKGIVLGFVLIAVMTALALHHHAPDPSPPVQPVVHHYTPSPLQWPVEDPEESTDQTPVPVIPPVPPATVIGVGTGGIGVLA